MKKRFVSSPVFTVLLCLLAAASLPGAERPGDNSGLAIEQVGVLVYPPKLLNGGVFSGEVRAVISVDEHGVLADCLVIGYTNPGFVDAVMAAMKRWNYRSAVVMGRARAARTEVLFTFRDRGVVVQSLPGAFEHYRVLGGSEEHYVYRPSKLGELDETPLLVHTVIPAVKKSDLEHKVTVEFYIDEEGRVRMPAVDRESVDDEYAAAAVVAVEQWRFKPCLRKGRPALVYAQQEFTFKP